MDHFLKRLEEYRNREKSWNGKEPSLTIWTL